MNTRTYIVSILGCVAAGAVLMAAGAALDALVLEIAGCLFVLAALLIHFSDGSARTFGNWALLMLAVVALAFVAQRLLG